MPHIINRKTSGVRLEPLNGAQPSFPGRRKKLFRKRKVRKKVFTDEDEDTGDDTIGFRNVLKKPSQLIRRRISFGYESDFEDDTVNQEYISCSDLNSERIGKNSPASNHLPFNPLTLSVIKEEEEEVKISATSNWTNEEYSDIEDPKWLSDEESDEEETWKEILHPYVRFRIMLMYKNRQREFPF